MKRIKKAVRKFVEENDLHGRPLTVGKIERIIIGQGFEIVYYDLADLSEKAQILAERLDLRDKYQSRSGFSYCKQDIKAVFVNQTLNEEDKLSVLLHEEAHIYLDHFYRQGLKETTTQHEKEANLFVLLLQKELAKENKWMLRIIAPTVATLLLSSVLIFRACAPDAPKPTEGTLLTTSQTELTIPDTSGSDTAPRTPIESVTESTVEIDPDILTYYWTQSGTVYHIYADCQHLKNAKSVQSGSLDDSGKGRCCKTCYARYLKEKYGNEG